VADLLVTIVYPEDCRATIQLPDVQDGQPALVAFGFVTPEDAVMTAEVKKAGVKLVDGKYLAKADPPYDWMCSFPAPAGGFATGQLLKVFVHATKGGTTVTAVRHVLFTEPGGSFGPSITISYPPPPSPGAAHVPASFTAYGLVNPDLAHGTTMNGASVQSSPPVLGTPVAAPAGFDWAFQFANVPNGTFPLIVQATNGGQLGSAQEPISVP
jgi:hypothetical protein